MVLSNYVRCLQINYNEFNEQARLPDGRVVAVKKLKGRPETIQAEEEFLTEVRLLSSIRHRNLVRLLGCCTREPERLLVYEFMSNNSLNKHLFGKLLPLILLFSGFNWLIPEIMSSGLNVYRGFEMQETQEVL